MATATKLMQVLQPRRRAHGTSESRVALDDSAQTEQTTTEYGTVPLKPTASTPGGELARRRYQKGTVLFNENRQVWLGRYREDVIQADGSIVRTRPRIILGAKKELPTKRLAARKTGQIPSPIKTSFQPPSSPCTVVRIA